MSEADREIVYRLKPTVDDGAEAEFDKLSTLAEHTAKVVAERLGGGFSNAFKNQETSIKNVTREAVNGSAAGVARAAETNGKAYVNGFTSGVKANGAAIENSIKAQTDRASKRIKGFSAAAPITPEIDEKQVAAALAKIEHLKNMAASKQQAEDEKKAAAAEKAIEKQAAAAEREAKAAERAADKKAKAEEDAAKRAFTTQAKWARMAEAAEAKQLKQEERDQKKVEAEQRRAERAAAAANEKQAAAAENLKASQAALNDKIFEGVRGVLQMAKGWAETSAAGGEANEKLLQSLVKIMGVFDLVEGGVRTYQQLAAVVNAYKASVEAAAVAERALAAARALSAAGGVKGAFGSVGGMMGVKAAITAGAIDKSAAAFRGMGGAMGSAAAATSAAQMAGGAGGAAAGLTKVASAAGPLAGGLMSLVGASAAVVAGFVVAAKTLQAFDIGEPERKGTKEDPLGFGPQKGLGVGAGFGERKEDFAKDVASAAKGYFNLADMLGLKSGLASLGYLKDYANAAKSDRETARKFEANPYRELEREQRERHKKGEVEDYEKEAVARNAKLDAISTMLDAKVQAALGLGSLDGGEPDKASQQTKKDLLNTQFNEGRQALEQALAETKAKRKSFEDQTGPTGGNEAGRARAAADEMAIKLRIADVDAQQRDANREADRSRIESDKQLLATKRQQLDVIKEQLRTMQGALKSDYARFADLTPEQQQALRRIKGKLGKNEELTKEEAALSGQFSAFAESTESNRAKKGKKEAGDLFGEQEEKAADLKRRITRGEETAGKQRETIVKLEIQANADFRAAANKAAKSRAAAMGIDGEDAKSFLDSVNEAVNTPAFKKAVQAVLQAELTRIEQSRRGKGGR